MVNIDFQRKFIQELYKRGYDQSNIYQEQYVTALSNEQIRMDVVIHNGNVVLQAFELKNAKTDVRNIEHQLRIYKQRFGRININAPIYCVIFNDDGQFEIFDENHVKQDVDKILNYDSAMSRIDKEVERTLTKEIPSSLCYICYISASLLLIYQLFVIVYSYCCGCCCYRLLIASPMNLIEYILMVILALIPSILKLQPKLLVFQIGMLKFTLALSQEYKPSANN